MKGRIGDARANAFLKVSRRSSTIRADSGFALDADVREGPPAFDGPFSIRLAATVTRLLPAPLAPPLP